MTDGNKINLSIDLPAMQRKCDALETIVCHDNIRIEGLEAEVIRLRKVIRSMIMQPELASSIGDLALKANSFYLCEK